MFDLLKEQVWPKGKPSRYQSVIRLEHDNISPIWIEQNKDLSPTLLSSERKAIKTWVKEHGNFSIKFRLRDIQELEPQPPQDWIVDNPRPGIHYIAPIEDEDD